jgi:D-glycero-D-manno-heptose 1,7-bisphosphate phosphatase
MALIAATNRCVFLDRDGVLNKVIVRNGRPFPPSRLEEFTLYPGVAEDCAQLKAAGFVLIVVSNQPDVGRRTQTREIIEAMHEKLRTTVPVLDGIEVCYHAGARRGDPCDCRKPKPGMLLRAAASHNLDLKRSFLIGDRWRDVDCAKTAGCRAIFIDHGYEESLRQKPDLTVTAFRDAVAFILQTDLSPSTAQG